MVKLHHKYLKISSVYACVSVRVSDGSEVFEGLDWTRDAIPSYFVPCLTNRKWVFTRLVARVTLLTRCLDLVLTGDTIVYKPVGASE